MTDKCLKPLHNAVYVTLILIILIYSLILIMKHLKHLLN